MWELTTSQMVYASAHSQGALLKAIGAGKIAVRGGNRVVINEHKRHIRICPMNRDKDWLSFAAPAYIP